MIRTTLLSEGTSDQVLTQIIDWALWEAGVRADLVSQWADLRNLRVKPIGLAAKALKAVDLYPCELLFVHRDADRENPATRRQQIELALATANLPPSVPIIPVRMQESWLLCDETAIRTAAGNPSSKVRLRMPKPAAVERLANPKEKVFELLRQASERTGRRLQQLNVEFARTQICQHINDFAKLRVLPSFAEFETTLRAQVAAHGFDRWP